MIYDEKFLQENVDPQVYEALVHDLKKMLCVAPILVWPFDSAPESLQQLFNHNGGDEDWLVVSNEPLDEHWLTCMDSMREPDEYRFPEGFRVYVGAHA